MEFMLMILDNEKLQAEVAEAEIGRIIQAHDDFLATLAREKILVSGKRLMPSVDGTVLRAVGEKRKTQPHPGPAEAVLGGFYILNCESKEEAVGWARKCPLFDGDSIEVRPIMAN